MDGNLRYAMRYGVKRVELTQADYELVKTARANLIVAMGIEEKYDIVLQNYLDYERALLTLTLEKMLVRGMDWSSFMDDRQLINWKLFNLLAAARLYCDQVKHNVVSIYGKGSAQFEGICQRFAQEYDGSLAYRVMEKLRNHVQHRSLPVHGVSYPARVRKGRAVRFTVEAFLDLEDLRAEGKFSPSVLEEIESRRGKNPNVTPFVREYAEALGRIHGWVRATIDGDLKGWSDAVIAIVERAQGALGRAKTTWVRVTAEAADGKVAESWIVNELVPERLSAFARRNVLLPNLSARYVSGRHKRKWDQN